MLMIGNIIQKDMEDGLILKMTIEQCILLLWKLVGGSLNKFMIKEEFIVNAKLCHFHGLQIQSCQILRQVQIIKISKILLL